MTEYVQIPNGLGAPHQKSSVCDALGCVPAERLPVHNHGPAEGPGLDCPERIINPSGTRRGKCMDDEALARALDDPATVIETTDPSAVMVTSPTGGTKGQKLARFDLIPAEALEQVAEVYGMGSKKYADNNWRKGYAWSLSFAAMMRHAWKFWRGETYDPESGLHHMAHVVFHALSLITNTDEHPEYDDRWKR